MAVARDTQRYMPDPLIWDTKEKCFTELTKANVEFIVQVLNKKANFRSGNAWSESITFRYQVKCGKDDKAKNETFTAFIHQQGEVHFGQGVFAFYKLGESDKTKSLQQLFNSTEGKMALSRTISKRFAPPSKLEDIPENSYICCNEIAHCQCCEATKLVKQEDGSYSLTVDLELDLYSFNIESQSDETFKLGLDIERNIKLGEEASVFKESQIERTSAYSDYYAIGFECQAEGRYTINVKNKGKEHYTVVITRWSPQ